MSPGHEFSSEQLQRVDALSTEAMQLAAAERRAFVEQRCADDPRVCAEVLGIIDAADGADTFLDTPAVLPGVTQPNAKDARAAPSEPPRRIGPYRIQAVLGEGGMGVVYRADQDQPRRTVALKVIRPGIAGIEVRRRFAQESAVLARLRHGGIGHIYDVGEAPLELADGRETDPLPYFAMELIDGQAIDRHVRTHDLGVADTLDLIADVCDAVHHAHTTGVVHRDLKPSNIIVDTAGQTKILDFGVARVTDSDLQVTTIQTGVGQLIGTIAYMSPEQVGGQLPTDVDARSDVYALGVIIYQLLAEKLPHDLRGCLITEAARAIQEDEPTRLGTLRAQFRGDIETIVSKAMDKDPARRYQSAAELGQDVRRYLASEPIAARDPSTFYQLRKFARRHRGLVAGTALAMLALLVGSVVATWQALEARRAQRVAEKRFKDARELASTFIFDMDERLIPLSGSLEVRKFVVETALAYCNELASEAADDPILADYIIKAYLRIGRVQGRPHNANIGDRDGALASNERALALAEQARERWPDKPRYLHNIGLAHEALATVLSDDGRYDEAERHLLAYADIATQTAAEVASDDPRQRDPGMAYHALGRAYEKQGRLDEAMTYYELSHAERVPLARDYPDHMALQLDVATSGSKIGDIHMRRGAHEQALELFKDSLAVRRRITELHAGDAEAVRALSLIWGRVGQALLSLDRTTEARAAFEEYLRIRRDLAEKAPSDSRAQRDLAVAYYRMGEITSSLEHHGEAVAHFRKFSEIIAVLVDKTPGSVRLRSNLAAGRTQVGAALIELGQLDEAADAFRAALDQTTTIIEQAPRHAETWTARILARIELGRILDMKSRYAEATDMLEAALADAATRREAGDTDIALDYLEISARDMLGATLTAWSEVGSVDAAKRAQRRQDACRHYSIGKNICGVLEERAALQASDVDTCDQITTQLELCDTHAAEVP